jgi:acyl-CoA thioester hydrolase
MKSESGFVATTEFPVRYAETDAMGIVHHASYLVYFEEARSAYTRARGRSYAEMEEDGYVLAVTEVQVNYRQSMRYGQTVRVQCWISDLKSRTVRFTYRLFDMETGELCVSGETGHICLNRDGRPSRFPATWNLDSSDAN